MYTLFPNTLTNLMENHIWPRLMKFWLLTTANNHPRIRITALYLNEGNSYANRLVSDHQAIACGELYSREGKA